MQGSCATSVEIARGSDTETGRRWLQTAAACYRWVQIHEGIVKVVCCLLLAECGYEREWSNIRQLQLEAVREVSTLQSTHLNTRSLE